ncbi:DeoR/GlpR family DNA-binding transcription regulator [Aneurinibacillus terranovensis]|uniref:DeoR/GlpR family DNA-binding transcription regulator n=1 Tax=Aneurinibacillus terranovensis TaxID=278991 RepID=UPI0004050679|nr:DeoR/GlpR family DNA-binding transcription regulator [Aneurinibacillus terranovensis]
MYQEERLLAILQHIKQHHRVSVQEICHLFGVSRDTARRDIVKLEEQGAIVRTRGGAILPTLTKEINNYKERLLFESTGKRAIGRTAASLIKNGDYIIMDASTTVQFAAEYFCSENNVVVTNSIDIAGILTSKKQVSIHLLGGKLNSEHRHVCGAQTIAMLADYQVDKLFLGACGITAEGLSYPHEEDGNVKREMIKRADQVIVLADHSKFGKKLFYRVASLDDIDLIITDREPDGDIADILHQHEIEMMVVPGEHTNMERGSGRWN